jgi:hypothetical protein
MRDAWFTLASGCVIIAFNIVNLARRRDAASAKMRPAVRAWILFGLASILASLARLSHWTTVAMASADICSLLLLAPWVVLMLQQWRIRQAS